MPNQDNNAVTTSQCPECGCKEFVNENLVGRGYQSSATIEELRKETNHAIRERAKCIEANLELECKIKHECERSKKLSEAIKRKLYLMEYFTPETAAFISEALQSYANDETSNPSQHGNK